MSAFFGVDREPTQRLCDVTVEQVTSELVRVIAVNHVRMQAYTCRDLARFAYDPRLTYKLEHRAERLERRADRIARGVIDRSEEHTSELQSQR